MTTPADIITDYCAAYLRANGHACEVIKRPGGWYHIRKPGSVWHGAQASSYRLGELPELTANLNARYPAIR